MEWRRRRLDACFLRVNRRCVVHSETVIGAITNLVPKAVLDGDEYEDCPGGMNN